MGQMGVDRAMEKFLNRHPLIRNALLCPRIVRRAWMRWRMHPADMVIERVENIVKSNILFEAKEFNAIFSVNPRSHLLHRLLREGYYEPRISGLFFSFINPEGDILDVGSNIGFFAVGGAKKLTTGRLLAAEPTSEAFERLSENVRRNGVEDRVILFKGLIGPSKGQAKIHYMPGREEYSSMNKLEHFATKDQDIRTDVVPVERLDDLVRAHGLRPSLVKVDVEGAEYSVFEGASRVLSEFRPIVISELWRAPLNACGRTAADVVRLFESAGYVVRDPHDRLAKPGLRDIGEIICIPKERYDPTSLEWPPA